MAKPVVKEILNLDVPSEDVTVEGWIRTSRSGKGTAFLELNDGSCSSNLQVVVASSISNFEELSKLGVGTAIEASGRLV